jgi:hypothetical protein
VAACAASSSATLLRRRDVEGRRYIFSNCDVVRRPSDAPNCSCIHHKYYDALQQQTSAKASGSSRGVIHLRGEAFTCCDSGRRLMQRADTAVAHGVSCAAPCHAAHQPQRRLLALCARVAHAAHDALHCSTAASAGEGHQRATFGALRGVVRGFGAHAAELVKPLGGDVDCG